VPAGAGEGNCDIGLSREWLTKGFADRSDAGIGDAIG
jgi:hypothetical protein